MKDYKLAIGRVFLLATLLALLPAACSWTKVHGITPISPKVGVDQTVDTLQPTFRWEPVAEPDARYDFVIFDHLHRKVYYWEGLQEPEHTLEVSL